MISRLQYETPLGKSDHSVLCFEIICEAYKAPPLIKPVLDKGNYPKLNQKLHKIKWTEELEKLKGDVEAQWDFFKGQYNRLEKLYVPRKKVYVNGNLKPKLSMRYDKATLRKFKKKNKIWGRIRKNLATEEEKLEHRLSLIHI